MNQFQTLTIINKSNYDDSYYGQISPDELRKLVTALDNNQVALNKNGNIALKAYKNTPKEGGHPFISVKWMPPRDAAPAAPAPSADVDFDDDLPF